MLEAPELRPSAQTLAQALELRRDIEAQKKAARLEPAVADARAMKLGQFLRPVYASEATARLQQAVSTERPWVERLTQFWANHFAVSVTSSCSQGWPAHLSAKPSASHVLGRFGDLLVAAETHAAMLLYLDNHLLDRPALTRGRAHRAAPGRAQGRHQREPRARDPRAAHARVGGGYTQVDVTSFAEVLTGWSIGGQRGGFAGGEPGQFVFRSELHEPGAKALLNRRYPDSGLDQGRAVLGDLARHPSTAHFIATKLTRHFIADEPPPAAVARVAGAFVASEGDLPSVYRALLEAREAWDEPLAKYKTPNDFLLSACRGLSVPVEPGNGALAPLELLGQRTGSPARPRAGRTAVPTGTAPRRS